jgi:hypothetical protein
MAEVFKAYQPGLDRFVAIKVMHAHLARSADFVERFRREARVVGQLQHAHIVRVIDFDIQDDAYYLVMDYVQGGTLKNYLRQHGSIPPERALPLITQLADALAYAHQYNMIHRDIKSDNIMFLDEHHTHTILSDFGIARLLSEGGLTLTGSLIGTPAYMSPEALRGERADARSDIYSLGVVIFEMLTGRTPYVADTPYSIIMKHMHEPLPEPREINPDVPESLNAFLLKALAKEPDDRFQSAVEMHAAIQNELFRPTTNPGSAAPATIARSAAPIAAETSTVHVGSQPGSESAPQLGTPEPPQQSAAAQRGFPRWLYLVGAGLVVGLVALLILPGVLDMGIAGGDDAAAEPGAAPAADLPDSAGVLQFLDNENARMGTILLQIDDADPPPADHHYQLWLAGDDETPLLSLGALPVEDGVIDATHTTSQNILDDYSEALVTIESDTANAEEPDREAIAFRGALPDEALPHIRQLLVAGADTDQALLGGAVEEANIAIDHSRMLQEALDAGDLQVAKRHAEHVINVLDGEDGPHFGDSDRDGRAENPGDGFGVRGYLEESSTQAQQVAERAPDAEMQHTGANGVIDASERSLTVVDDAIDKALQFSATDSVDEGQSVAAELRALLDSLLTGTDEDEDGTISPFEEGTILSAYEFGALIGSIALFPDE